GSAAWVGAGRGCGTAAPGADELVDGRGFGSGTFGEAAARPDPAPVPRNALNNSSRRGACARCMATLLFGESPDRRSSEMYFTDDADRISNVLSYLCGGVETAKT